MSRMSALGFLAIGLLLSITTLTTNANDGKIVPGERIGDVSLTMSVDAILKTLGQPSRVEKDDRNVRYEWAAQFLRVFQSLERGSIVSIRTYWQPPTRADRTGSPGPYKTEKGIAIGATPEEARRAYGDAGCVFRDTSGGAGDVRVYL